MTIHPRDGAERADTMNLNLFFSRTGHHRASWRLGRGEPGGVLDDLLGIARLAERGALDSVFFADVLHAPPAATATPPSCLEPVTALSALAAATERIGLIGTLSATYNAPYHIARRLAALDHLSGGRAGWNVVTSRHDAEARNFSDAPHADRADRYARAAESIEVVRALWDSWSSDGPRPVDHTGRHFSVAGPLNIPRPPQGHPVLVQAGGSDEGRDLAARHADALFAVQPSVETARAFYADIKRRTAALGRDPAGLRVLPGVYLLIGSTEEELRRRQAELDALVDVENELPWLAHFLRLPIGPDDLDRRVADLDLPETAPTSQAFHEVLIGRARRAGHTLREVLHRTAAGAGHFRLVGTPERVADELESWFRTGAADGFNLKPAVVPTDLAHFVDQVLPRLRRRGVFRAEYTGRTLREHYGLTRPEDA
ncbi:NtaA/DmoA family FMN-dependent monooxygenase [Streptomyces sp. NBRC 109706]|uniref:NtaA/DmoA family FMN-dependent monooxygenase n=1 Tax=Streptomyces sp. NBRC 109706 TaxID=1550035 RepID=UPI000783796A|nr:NtaA/DmoA family FMN-dependent monooxygenase [Streptomyces sp. NBRC 109706]